MTLKSLDEFSALSPGCELWMLADPSLSRWARRIDWYLNFQIMKAQRHQAPQLSIELKKILDEDWEEGAPQIPVRDNAPLLVASADLLPSSKTVVVPFTGNTAEWAKACHRLWRELQYPKVRIFLPSTVDSHGFTAAWPKKDEGAATAEIEFVADATFPALT